MKHNVKTVSRFLLLSLTLGCAFFAFGQNNRSITAAHAEEESSSEQSRTFTEADFVDELEADPEELDLSLIQSTTTDTSQSLNFAFKSKTFVGYQASISQDFIVNISDPSFTGDINAPVSEDFDNFDEDTGLPLFDGELLFIVKDTLNSQEAFIPSSLTLRDTFTVNITSICANCVTAPAYYDGDGGNNSWYLEDGVTLKYSAIHIPSTITTIRAGAFKGVPADMTITYEGSEIPEGFADGWTDSTNIVLNTYGKESNKKRYVGSRVFDIVDELGRPINFCLGCKPDGTKLIGNDYDRPLVIEFNVVSKSNPEGPALRHVFEELPLTNTNHTPYDSVGPHVSSSSYSRLYGYKLSNDEVIDLHSIRFHNIMKFKPNSFEIDTTKRYSAKLYKIPQVLDISNVVTFKATNNATFAGYSLFSLTMDKNLSLTSEKYPEPHSLYLDAKTDFYEQNKSKIEAGLTEIRYSLYNLYLSSFHFVYEGKDGLKEATIPVSTVISYQTLEKDAGNKISILLKNSDVASDFSADKVKTFEIVNLTIQLDLLATSDSGSKSKLAKSEVSYKFAYLTIINNENIKVFNWNLFLIIFLVGYIAVFVALAFALYKYKKEKYKNDEFRRVNDKKYLKSSILYGFGFMVIVYAIIFIFMRAVGFANTIVVFNPTDPLLIAFAIAGMIIGGYFIVLAIKSIKTERERRKAIRLKLNEDVEDDGTN